MTTEKEIVMNAEPGNWLRVVDPNGRLYFFEILERDIDELTLERECDGEEVEIRTKDLKKALDRVNVVETPLEFLYMTEWEAELCS